MDTEREWFIEAPWGRICVVAWGDCFDPPVLVCHGRNDSAAGFRPLLRLLPKKFYYICMELPGNGKSDPFPKGLIVQHLDFVYAIEVVRRNFRWDQFVFLSHSLGAVLGRYYNACFPGKVTKLIELDHVTLPYGFNVEDFPKWYERIYVNFFENYDKYNAPKESAPPMTWEEAIEKTANIRQISPEIAREILERFSEPAGDGHIRLTIDQRLKMPIAPLLSHEQIKCLYMGCRTPTLGLVCTNTVKIGAYKNTPYMLQEDGFEGSYKVRMIDGSHDVHIVHPEKVAPFISQFLLYGLDSVDRKAKL